MLFSIPIAGHILLPLGSAGLDSCQMADSALQTVQDEGVHSLGLVLMHLMSSLGHSHSLCILHIRLCSRSVPRDQVCFCRSLQRLVCDCSPCRGLVLARQVKDAHGICMHTRPKIHSFGHESCTSAMYTWHASSCEQLRYAVS